MITGNRKINENLDENSVGAVNEFSEKLVSEVLKVRDELCCGDYKSKDEFKMEFAGKVRGLVLKIPELEIEATKKM